MWGSYLFDEAHTAEERRVFRTSRRRISRIRTRLDLLQSLFADEISKVDDTFFIRLNDGKLLPEDKDNRITTKYILFGDNGYTDKEYFKRYPTVSHLRKSLMEAPPEDIRLLYIACHHIIKNRGHFLFAGQSFSVSDPETIKTSFRHINSYFENNASEETGDFAVPFELGENDRNLISAISVLKSEKMSGTEKVKRLTEIFGIDKKDKQASAVLKLMSGNSCSIDELYCVSDVSGLDDKYKKIDFKQMTDEQFVKVKTVTADDYLLDSIKAIYDWSKLVNILGEFSCLSVARVNRYETHKSDLALLKRYIKENCPNKKHEVFRRQEKMNNNYADYIGMDKHKSYSKCKKDDFYKFLEKHIFKGGKEEFFAFAGRIVESGETDEHVKTLKERYERGEFLPRQMESGNGIIPYQLHEIELDKILQKASERYEFLSEKDENGITMADKIKLLLTFRIPYYVGPTQGHWAVRKVGMEHVRALPWNFEQVIDLDKSEDAFIEQMTCKCSYIPTEDVLPKNSILYSEATLLNEINNIKINGQKDERAIKIVYYYAHRNKNITANKIIELLKINGYDIGLIDKSSITGIDEGKVRNSLGAYIDFKAIIGDAVDTRRDMCEEIIKWVTLSSDDERLVKRITAEYGKVLTKDQIRQISKLRYSGWGRLSKKVLDGITSTKAVYNGKKLTVIEAMQAFTINMTEALTASRWGFDKAIEQYNKENCDGRIRIDDLYCSPSVKRTIRRMLAIIKEIVKVKGYAPKKIIIEMSRGDESNEKGKRKASRKEQLLALYKSIELDKRDWIGEIELTDERKFSSRKLFLYYLQMGKCMYTNESIELKDLTNDNLYDIDHIYPQSKINDDSLDNIVLVKKQVNANKTDQYPLDARIRTKMKEFWAMLKTRGYISEKKYRRLVRNTPLTTDELAEFENRQIVMTQQSTKETARILKTLYPKTEIVYSKARKAADFKNRLDEYAKEAGLDEEYRVKLIKVRELNDLHHAKDAYINVVAGNVFNEEYGHDLSRYYSDRTVEESRSDYRLFWKPVKDAWKPSIDIPTIVKTYYRNDCSVVRFVSENSGQLFDLQPVTKKAGLVPLKANGAISDTTKYGGYNSAKTAYFALVKSKGKKGEVKLTLEAIPVMIEKTREHNPNAVKEYVENQCELTKPQIVLNKIRINTLLKINGTPMYIRGKTGHQVVFCNAVELFLNMEDSVYLKKVMNVCKKLSEAKATKKAFMVDEELDGVNVAKNVRLYDTFLKKLHDKIYSGMTAFENALKNLKYCREQFQNMSVETQCEQLTKILLFFNCNPVNLDLSSFVDSEGKPFGKDVGKCLISKSIEKLDVKIIYQSPTGQYKEVIDVKKFL